MYKTILVPTDGSALSGTAVKAAIEFARSAGAALVVLAVAEPMPLAAGSDSYFVADPGLDLPQLLALAQARADDAAVLAQAAGVRCETVTAVSYNPHEEIIKAANDRHCDIIFMASHGRGGIGRLLLGSVTQKVLAHTALPVLVYR